MNQLSVKDLAQWLAEPERPQPLLLDVREAWELQTASLPAVTHIPMQQIPARVAELDGEREIVAICHHGARSMQVALYLERQGLKVHNLAGGIERWSLDVDPTLRRY